MVRIEFSWRTAVAATFFVMLLGLNSALVQSAGDMNTKKNSTNFQTIIYGTPKQKVTSKPIDNSADDSRTVNTVIPKHDHGISAPKVDPAPIAQPEKCSPCPKGSTPTATGCGCTVPRYTCQPCDGYHKTELADPMMCETMCVYE